MFSNPTVAYSLFLWVLFILLPLIPAILLFRLFPNTAVSVSGPLQNLTVNATGAFAAYLVTALLGFFLVQHVEKKIDELTGVYPVNGVIVDLGPNQALDSDQFYARYVTESPRADGSFNTRNYYFVVLLDHPVVKPEEITLKFWDYPPQGIGTVPMSSPSGVGMVPTSHVVKMQLPGTHAGGLRYRLLQQNSEWVIKPETSATPL